MDRNTSNHPYRDLRVPNTAGFKLQPSSSGKGWGAFATSNIKQGALILSEKPLFIIEKAHEDITEKDVWTAFQQLAPAEKQQFLLLRDNASSPFKSMEEAFAENSFELPYISGHGLYLLHSRFNHSCIPNANIPITDNEIIKIFAIEDIIAGDEITFCYNPDFECRTRHDRHKVLRFTCDCKACLIGTDFHHLSDMRRTLIRGLQYITLGVDLDGKRQGSASAIIIDKELKAAAETFNIPLSTRLICNVFIVLLLQEEQLLDEFMVRRFNPRILRISRLFQTESNAMIARNALAQPTWLERFCTVLALYGRRDAADHGVALALQMRHGLPEKF
ncbi:hypothetical protein N0V90_011117 [Kalmusia sp. IMI 367209]|nr:hypothetical protein N0V90_011117 [Kalmusia sp. IMI 367209]